MTGPCEVLLTVVSVWVLLGCGAWAEREGLRHGVPASFAAATFLVAASRGRQPRRAANRDAGVWLLGIAAGSCSAISLTLLVLRLGLELGMEPPRARADRPRDTPGVVSMLVLAPAFEELLYRERLPDALRRLPVALRAVVSSALFAVPHAEPWRVLGTFWIGLLLAAVHRATGSVALCIAVHAGLNLGALVGVTPAGVALPTVLGGLAFAAAVRRARAAGRGPEDGP